MAQRMSQREGRLLLEIHVAMVPHREHSMIATVLSQPWPLDYKEKVSQSVDELDNRLLDLLYDGQYHQRRVMLPPYARWTRDTKLRIVLDHRFVYGTHWLRHLATL